MKLERISGDKIRFFLTFDDLTERGIKKEDMFRDMPKIHDLFHDMMEQAYFELGFEVNGPIAVEVFALPAQGMVVIITKASFKASVSKDEEELDDELDVYEMQVILEQTDQVLYKYNDLEHLIQCAKQIKPYIDAGVLYFYKQQYYLLFEELNLSEQELNNCISILSEYGEASHITKTMLDEYGKLIFPKYAIDNICYYFQ